MRELVAQYLSHSISRRGFVSGLSKAGFSKVFSSVACMAVFRQEKFVQQAIDLQQAFAA